MNLKKINYRKLKKRTNLILISIGFIFFFYLIYRIGIDNIVSNLSSFGFWFIPIFFLGGIWILSQAKAWNIIQNQFFRRASIFFFFRLRIIGDALNNVLPSANLGGDAARAYLIKNNIPLNEGIAGVFVDKTIEFIGGMLFTATGLLVSFLFSYIPESLILPGLICLGITFLGITTLIILQLNGFYKILLKITSFIPSIQRLLKNQETKFRSLENNLRMLYTKAIWKMVLALAFHYLARILGAVEVFIILKVLGIQTNFIEALFISAMVTIINTIFFLMPGQWGVTEGAFVLVLKSLGYSAGIGLSLGIIRRIRKLFYVGLGLLFFSFRKGIKLSNRSQNAD